MSRRRDRDDDDTDTDVRFCPYTVSRTGIFALPVVLADPTCGCLCLHSGHTHIDEKCRDEVPPELIDIYRHDDWVYFVRRFDQIMDATVHPECPCCCTHFCIPFLPACYESCMAWQRERRLRGLFEEENQRLEVEGIAWTGMGHWRKGFVLEWHPTRRPVIEARDPAKRRITMEAPLIACLPPLEKKAALRAQEIIAEQQRAQMGQGATDAQQQSTCDSPTTTSHVPSTTAQVEMSEIGSVSPAPAPAPAPFCAPPCPSPQPLLGPPRQQMQMELMPTNAAQQSTSAVSVTQHDSSTVLTLSAPIGQVTPAPSPHVYTSSTHTQTGTDINTDANSNVNTTSHEKCTDQQSIHLIMEEQ